MHLAILSRIHQFLWRSSLGLSNFVCGAFLYPGFYCYCFEFIPFRNHKFPILLSFLFGFISIGIQSKGLSHNIIVHPVFVFGFFLLITVHGYCSRCTVHGYCSRCTVHGGTVHGGTVHGTVHFYFYFKKKKKKKQKKKRNRKKRKKKRKTKIEKKRTRGKQKKNSSYSVHTWCLLKVLKVSCLHILFSLYIVLFAVF